MSEFNVKSEHVDVEQIMRRIRGRIKEKRGVDYTDQEVRELANVKLERFLDPKNVRSDLVAHYRRTHRPAHLPPPPDNFNFESLYTSGRSGLLTTIRRLLHPILKLFFSAPLLDAILQQQRVINAFTAEQHQAIGQRLFQRDELDALNFEVLNNLVVEMTRLSIEVKNLKMRLESLATRLDFDERRARALETIVQYRPESEGDATPDAEPPAAGETPTEEQARLARRRRRRRGRRRPGGPDGSPSSEGGVQASDGGGSASSDSGDDSSHGE
ncbi:MAG: hypothetical protein U0Q12_22825 [Vicinamibacterales bacterium]